MRGGMAARGGHVVVCMRGAAAWVTGRRRAAGPVRRARGAAAAAGCARTTGVRAMGRAGAAGGTGRVAACHWANRLSSAASIGAIRRRNSRPSSSPSQPPDISPARAPFSPVKGLETGDVFIVNKLVNNADCIKGFFRVDGFFWAWGKARKVKTTQCDFEDEAQGSRRTTEGTEGLGLKRGGQCQPTE